MTSAVAVDTRTGAALIALGLLISAACGTRVDQAGDSGTATGPVREAAAPSTPTPAASPGAAGTAAPSPAPLPAAVGPSSSSVSRGAGLPSPATRLPNPATETGAARFQPGAQRDESTKPGPVPEVREAPLTPADPPAQGSPLVIGSVGPRSGPIGAVQRPAFEAVQVWARYINERGGLNGHEVSVLIGDDGGDPARRRAVVQEFVERRGVIAFVQNFESLGGAASQAYLTSKRIPVIGSEQGPEYFYQHPNYFPQQSAGDQYWLAMTLGWGQAALPKGRSRLGIISCAEVEECKRGGRLVANYSSDAGLKLVYEAQASIAQPDYTAVCLSAQNAGVEVLMLVLDGQSVSRLAASCARQGFRPMFALHSVELTGEHPADANLQGAIISSVTFPFVVDSTPATAEFHATFRKFLPDTAISGLHSTGWVSAKLLERGGAGLSEPPTNESLLAGLWSVRGDDLGGLTAPLTFTPEAPAQRTTCWFVMVIEHSKLAVLNGGARSCRDPS